MSTTLAAAGGAASTPPRRLHPSRWTLRTRLVAVMVALLAVMSMVFGAVTLFALNHVLTNQLASQLASAANRGIGGPDGHGDGHGFNNPVDGPNQALGTLGAVVQNGAFAAQPRVITQDAAQKSLSAAAQQVVLAVPADGATHAVDLGDGLGRYLVIASPEPNGLTYVTGLPLGPMQSILAALAVVALLVTLIALLIAAVAGAAIVRLTLRPLDRLAATATRVSELPLDRGDVSPDITVLDADTDPGTEVGQVGAALERMLGHVFRALQVRNASEARMRRFVADASHELRTPLASIRGYAELTLRRSDDLNPQVEHALSRVESEAIRMTGLVEDLLLLARLDDGAEAASLRRERVDLTAVAVDCVADAHVLGAQHRWLLDLPEDPVTITGDSARLRQVLTNLLANARVHTPAGTTVNVRLTGPEPAGSSATRPEVRLEVSDDGPGIPPELLPEVFDRFTRADSSRSRAAGSTGLGLSIVASVVEAHDGRVEVTSRPGSTTFTVHLPVDVAPTSPSATGSAAGIPAGTTAGNGRLAVSPA